MTSWSQTILVEQFLVVAPRRRMSASISGSPPDPRETHPYDVAWWKQSEEFGDMVTDIVR